MYDFEESNIEHLILPKGKKATKDGKIPIYVRVTIDGYRDEFSTGCKVFRNFWDNDHKQVLTSAPEHRQINKKLLKTEVDLQRHFDLIQAKKGIATPRLYKIGQNAAMKYCQTIKEIMEIAASKKWVSFNVFSTFKCRYKRVTLSFIPSALC